MNNYHILTVTVKGVVSLIKNLSKEDAKAVYDRLIPKPMAPGTWHYVRDSDFERVEIIGPENE